MKGWRGKGDGDLFFWASPRGQRSDLCMERRIRKGNKENQNTFLIGAQSEAQNKYSTRAQTKAADLHCVCKKVLIEPRILLFSSLILQSCGRVIE